MSERPSDLPSWMTWPAVAVALLGIAVFLYFAWIMGNKSPTPVAEVVQPNICYLDEDHDGYGSQEVGYEGGSKCPPALAINADDCDDTRDDVHPKAKEVCDGVDNNCDGRIDYLHGFQVDDNTEAYLACEDLVRIKEWPEDQPCIDLSIIFPNELEPQMWHHCITHSSTKPQGRDLH